MIMNYTDEGVIKGAELFPSTRTEGKEKFGPMAGL